MKSCDAEGTEEKHPKVTVPGNSFLAASQGGLRRWRWAPINQLTFSPFPQEHPLVDVTLEFVLSPRSRNQ
ncbi:hypothetical protein V2G26_011453 [Clonostachys chloroleuca]